MQNSATSPSLTCLLDRYPLWIGYNRIEQIGLHTMFMRFTCTAQNRRKPCKTIMQPRVWWPLYGHCHLTWRSQDWEYCCLPPPSATEGQLALSVQVDLASSSRIYLMFDEAPSARVICAFQWFRVFQHVRLWKPKCVTGQSRGGRLKDVIFRACPYEWCFSSRCSCLPFVLFVVRGFP